MPTVFPAEQNEPHLKRYKVEGPLSLSLIRRVCLGSFREIPLLSGDLVLAPETTTGPINNFATFLTKQEVRGDVIICSPEDLP